MIEFPPVTAPTVSIVVITYGGWEWVEPALRAIIEHTPPCYEVIVIDNASPDGTGQRVAAEVSGATIVLNEENHGFGLAANQGALHAVGPYLLFLNSDAYVEPGWLEPLLEVLESDAGVGAVAPCLLEPDGRMQEAAGLVAGDGWVGQFGMGDDPARPQYRFRREVDYASGAALLVRRREFLRSGGFDPAYVMGYYEDVDLCFGLWERGLATVYEPRSRVIHLRGASGTSEIAMRHAVPNHGVFVGKWGDELARRHPISALADYPHRLVASRDARALERILLITDQVPSEDARLAQIATDLVTRWPRSRVTLIAAGLLPVPDVDGVDSLLRNGVEVAWGEDWEAWFAARRFHYSVAWVCGPDAHECFDDVLHRTQPQAVRVYDGPGRRPADIVCWESVDDAPPGALVIPARRTVAAQPAPFDNRSGILVVDGLDFVLDQVMPRLWAHDPAARLTVIGPGVADVDPRVGSVPPGRAAARLRAQTRLHLAPLGSPGAMASPLLDSMAAGLPFVTTSAGTRRLGLGRSVVADTPEAFARRAVTLYTDRDEWDGVQQRLLALAAGLQVDPADDPLARLMAAVGAAPARARARA